MKDGNEGHGMNKKYEKFKLAVGTTFENCQGPIVIENVRYRIEKRRD